MMFVKRWFFGNLRLVALSYANGLGYGYVYTCPLRPGVCMYVSASSNLDLKDTGICLNSQISFVLLDK